MSEVKVQMRIKSRKESLKKQRKFKKEEIYKKEQLKSKKRKKRRPFSCGVGLCWST